jgi:hypothetical protein
MFNNKGIPTCPLCGMKFDNVFSAVSHMLEDDEEFDPALLLPGGYKLMVGSLLEALFEHRTDPNMISKITQDAYSTLFLAEASPEMIAETIEDIIVEDTMEGLDDELKKLFKNGE